MIIIKTKTGDIFVNDKETIRVSHNRDEHTAYIFDGKCMGTIWRKPPIEHVESVTYINEQTGKEWKDEGSQVAYLQKMLSFNGKETSCDIQIIEKLEENLRNFASEMIQIVQYHNKEIPDKICDQIRNRGEEMKELANDGTWKYRVEYMEAHKVSEQAEADENDRLNRTIEEQAAKIFQLSEELRCEKANNKFYKSTDEKSAQEKPSFMQRIKQYILSMFHYA